ncbi:hypothetical protein HXY32_08185 [Candidatus Bathyarchaeota archaeon]|nr:hypothetical protein [Candidatus Bathyarchaeota archaeon]
MKAKAIMLIFLAIFAAFTTLAVVSSSIQVDNGDSNSDVASSYGTVQINDKFVQPNGFPIDSPGGPT